jgi:signal peptidase I
MRRLSRLQNNLLTLGAVLGALCLAVAIAAVLTGAKPLVFRSGSMAPAIPTGALAISIPVEARNILVGDIISVENSAGVRITHRVVTADMDGGVATVTLRGDANAVQDATPYVLREADRVVAHAPLVGYAVAWLTSSAAVFAGGLLTAYLLYLAFGQPRRRPSGPDDSKTAKGQRGGRRASRGSSAARRSGRPRRRATKVSAMALACVSVLTGTAVHSAAPSQAAFIDNAAGTALIAAGVLAEPSLACRDDGNDVILTITRPADDFAAQYDLRPEGSWDSGNWSGTSVEVPVTPADFSFNDETTIEFTATSSVGSWAETSVVRNVYYTPDVSILFIGLVPASLSCSP